MAYCFGWDISTAIIGFVAFKDGKFFESRHCDLRKVDGDISCKGDVAYDFVFNTLDDYILGPRFCDLSICKHVHFIEDKLSGFGGGGSNANTMMKLAAFNAMVSWMIRFTWANKHDGTIQHIHPSTVKAIMKREGLEVPRGGDKKKLTFAWVTGKEPNLVVDLNKKDNPQPWMYDKCDAYITAYAGMRKFPEICNVKKS